MTTHRSQERDDLLPPAVRAEAAAWVARLHGSVNSRALEAGFRRWLEADAAHKDAFELATEAWEIGGSIPVENFRRIDHRNTTDYGVRRRRLRKRPGTSRLVLAAALSAVAIASLLYVTGQGSAISTAVGEQRMLTLDDGSRITLNTDTRLTVEYGEAQRRVRLTHGEALFDVAKDPQRPFTVSAGETRVRALGTAFLVRRDSNQLTVTLMEGTVAVTSPDGEGQGMSPSPSQREGGPQERMRIEQGMGNEEVQGNTRILSPGQRLVFNTASASAKIDEPRIETVTAWRRGEVVLDKTPLGDAIAEMNRYSAVKLVLDSPDIANILLSGIFRAGDSARFAQVVAETYHLSIDHQDRQIRLSSR